MKRQQFNLTEKQIARLNKESNETGLNMSDIVRRALDLYFKKARVGYAKKKDVEEGT